MTWLPPPAWVHLIYFGVYLPYRTWRHRNVWPSAAERRARIESYEANILHFVGHGVMSLATVFILWTYEGNLLPRCSRRCSRP